MDKEKLVSIIIPVYNEGSQIKENVEKVSEILLKNDIQAEFILVDDGSSDKSWFEIGRLCTEGILMHAIRLSRNFGKEGAITAGLNKASGDACIIMDADLQHPPEIIPEMYRLWLDGDYDVIDGVKNKRGKESLAYKVCAKFFYSLLYKLSKFDLRQGSDFKFLDRKVIDTLNVLVENKTFFRGLSHWVGYKRTSVYFDVAEREKGESKWSFLGLVKFGISAITSFSAMPLYIVTFIGILFSVVSFVLGIQTIYMKFVGEAVSGFTTVIILLLIIGSSIMISLGVIGIYIENIYNEVKSRPKYIISEELKGTK